MSDSKRTKPWWRRPAVGWVLVWVVITVIAVVGTRFYTPGTEPSSTSGEQDIVTDVAGYAEQEFSASIVPTIEQNAQDLPTLVEALAAGADAAGDKYGHRSGDSPWSFPVSATGTIGEASFGEVALSVDGVSGVEIGVQTGPAIKGTAVRDAVGTITFGMFQNQTAFSQVATELNNQVKATVFSEYDLASMQGQEVTILGAFSYDDPSHILITPVRVEVK